MSLEAAITFFIAIFIFGITPGPGVFAILARAMIHGPRKCYMLALGMVSSDLIYLIAACFGLASLADNYAEVFVVIRYLGAVYLIYLGYKMFKALPHVKDTLDTELDTKREAELDSGLHKARKDETPSAVEANDSPLASFSQGFLISASNPKVILFYISFLPTFIDLTVLKTQDIVLVSILSSLALMSGIMLIAYGASRMANMLKTPLAHKRLNQSAGSIMIAAGSYLAISK